MSDDEEDAIAFIATVIKRYIEIHPAAADTAVGIQQWWVPATLLEEPLPLIELALDRLVQEGVARRTSMEDGNVIYSNARRGAVSDLIDDPTSDPVKDSL